MSGNTKKVSKEDLILYLLNKIEPEKSTLLRLNKLAFFAEFGFIYKQQKELSDAQYAAIDYGPIINDYKKVLSKMEKEKKILIDKDGKHIRPLVSAKLVFKDEDKKVLDNLIEKYSQLNNNELVGLSHSTDSYKITTHDSEKMGNIIDKDLAYLESFFDESSDEEIKADKLPNIDRSELVEYEIR